MKDVIQPVNILKSHKNETYSVNDGRVKVTEKTSKYFSQTLLLSRLCEDHHEHKHQEAVSMRVLPKSIENWGTRNTRVLSRKTTSKKIEKTEGKAQISWILFSS